MESAATWGCPRGIFACCGWSSVIRRGCAVRAGRSCVRRRRRRRMHVSSSIWRAIDRPVPDQLLGRHLQSSLLARAVIRRCGSNRRRGRVRRRAAPLARRAPGPDIGQRCLIAVWRLTAFTASRRRASARVDARSSFCRVKGATGQVSSRRRAPYNRGAWLPAEPQRARGSVLARCSI